MQIFEYFHYWAPALICIIPSPRLAQVTIMDLSRWEFAWQKERLACCYYRHNVIQNIMWSCFEISSRVRRSSRPRIIGIMQRACKCYQVGLRRQVSVETKVFGVLFNFSIEFARFVIAMLVSTSLFGKLYVFTVCVTGCFYLCFGYAVEDMLCILLKRICNTNI